MRYKFEEEIKRFQKFQKGVLGIKENPKTEKEIDIRTYAKYLRISISFSEIGRAHV